MSEIRNKPTIISDEAWERTFGKKPKDDPPLDFTCSICKTVHLADEACPLGYPGDPRPVAEVEQKLEEKLGERDTAVLLAAPYPSICPFCKAGEFEDSRTAGMKKCSNCGAVALPGTAKITRILTDPTGVTHEG